MAIDLELILGNYFRILVINIRGRTYHHSHEYLTNETNKNATKNNGKSKIDRA